MLSNVSPELQWKSHWWQAADHLDKKLGARCTCYGMSSQPTMGWTAGSVLLLQKTRFIITDVHEMRHRKFTVLILRMDAHIIVQNVKSTSESLNKLCAEHRSLNYKWIHTYSTLIKLTSFWRSLLILVFLLLSNYMTSRHDEALMSNITDSDSKGEATHSCSPLCDLAT